VSGAPPRPSAGAGRGSARAAPSTSARLVSALLAARFAFGLAYLAGTMQRAPIPWYHPLERAWSFGREPGGWAAQPGSPGGVAAAASPLAMEWFGRTASATAAAIAAGAIVWAAAARGPLARALARPELVLALARACGLALLIDFAYFGWVLMHPVPAPLPLPSCLR
jgi:hypothetical protein